MSKNPKIEHERFSRGRIFCERYRIVRRVGHGSVGEVYEALDLELEDQAIALKVLHPHLSSDKATLQRFQNEVYISRQLSHPNIARVYDFCEDGAIKFLTIEYISGCNLQEIAESYPRNMIPRDEVVYLLRQIASALAYAHNHEVTHRDVKPGNILIEKSGVAKLSDFGLAHSIETANGLTRTGELIGTPCYLAPECFLQPGATKTADTYAFGVLMFELLSGTLPFESPSYHELGTLHRTAPMPVEKLEKASVPDSLIELIAACLAKRPEERPQDGQALEQALDATRCESNPDQSQVLLQTMVNRKRRDSFYTDPKVRTFGRIGMVLIFILFPVLMGIDQNQRERVALDLSRIEAHTQLSTATLRWLLGFGAYDLKNIDDLINMEQVEQDWYTKVFLAGGINLNTRVDKRTRNTALHELIDQSNYRTDVLINRSKSYGVINEKNNAGDTALMRAVKLGNISNVGLLLRPRISVVSEKAKRNPKIPPEAVAVPLNKTSDVFRGHNAYLIPGADQSIRDKSGNLPLHIAIASGDLQLTRVLLSDKMFPGVAIDTMKNDDGLAPLHLAAMLSERVITKTLLQYGFPVDSRDSLGRTPLMIAITQKPGRQSEAIVTRLLQEGASLTARDDEGRSVYDHARAVGRESELPLLPRPALSSTTNKRK